MYNTTKQLHSKYRNVCQAMQHSCGEQVHHRQLHLFHHVQHIGPRHLEMTPYIHSTTHFKHISHQAVTKLYKYQQKISSLFPELSDHTEHTRQMQLDWQFAGVHRHCMQTRSAYTVPSLSQYWPIPADIHTVTAASCMPLPHCPLAVTEIPLSALHITIPSCY